MIKTSYYLDCRYRKSGSLYPLYLVLYDGKQRVSIPVNITLSKEDWDQKKQEVVSGTATLQLNTFLKEHKILTKKAFWCKKVVKKRLKSALWQSTGKWAAFKNYDNTKLYLDCGKSKSGGAASLKFVINKTESGL